MAEREEKGMDRRKLIELVKEGLATDGAHHKQWYLEQIGKEIGMDDTDFSDFEEGVAP